MNIYSHNHARLGITPIFGVVGILVLAAIAGCILPLSKEVAVMCVCATAFCGYLLLIRSLSREGSKKEAQSLELIRQIIEGIQREDTLREVGKFREEFIASMAHELRTPLTAVHGFSKLLVEKDRSDESAECVKFIHQGAERLRLLVDQLVLSTSISSGSARINRTRCSAFSLLEEVKAKVGELVSTRGINLEVTRGVGDIVFECDREKVIGVLSQLTARASEFTMDLSPIILQSSVLDGSVLLEVRWHGAGFDFARAGELLSRAMVPEEAGNAIENGVCVAGKVAALHGGKLRLFQQGQGECTFQFVLPGLSSTAKEEGPCRQSPEL